MTTVFRQMPSRTRSAIVAHSRAVRATQAKNAVLAVSPHARAGEPLRSDDGMTWSNGEAVLNSSPDSTARELTAAALASQVNVDASLARTDLLTQIQFDVLALAVDAAQSAGARESLEKMLAHQLALLHSISMRAVDRAQLTDGDDRIGLLNATASLMRTFQQGMLTFDCMRKSRARRFEGFNSGVEVELSFRRAKASHR